MTAVPRQRSPHAHDRGDECGSCRDCRSCDGGRSDIPRSYRVIPPPAEFPTWPAAFRCSDCADHGTTCLNLVKEP